MNASRRGDLNSQLSVYKTDTLPVELQRQPAGISPLWVMLLILPICQRTFVRVRISTRVHLNIIKKNQFFTKCRKKIQKKIGGCFHIPPITLIIRRYVIFFVCVRLDYCQNYPVRQKCNTPSGKQVSLILVLRGMFWLYSLNFVSLFSEYIYTSGFALFSGGVKMVQKCW